MMQSEDDEELQFKMMQLLLLQQHSPAAECDSKSIAADGRPAQSSPKTFVAIATELRTVFAIEFGRSVLAPGPPERKSTT